MPSGTLRCDGCGQPADEAHIARRLKRLENLTRYRPIHVQAVFLGAMSPAAEADYLYSARTEFFGEGLTLLRALDVETQGKSCEAVLADFQRRGYLLTYVLECPVSVDSGALRAALSQRLATTAIRIRRSLKPKKLVLLGGELGPFVVDFANALSGIPTASAEKLEPGSLAVMLDTTPASTL